jgi:hypothetical protein|tara:strand:- start:72 stop:539 length:468 start_codon:yes stop_codon:yes gene_type:complete
MNKLTSEQITKLKDLISDVKTEGYSKYSGLQGANKKRLKTQFTPVSFDNKELVSFLCNVSKQDPLKVKNIHIVTYRPGESINEHRDLSAMTLVIITEDNFKGGKLVLNGTTVDNFKSNGDYLIFNGAKNPHFVTEVTEGLRQTISVFFDDKISII